MSKINRNHPLAPRNRKIGRKALQADKVAHVLDRSAPKERSRRISFPRFRTRTYVTAAVVIVALFGAVAVGSRMHSESVAASKKAEAIRQEKIIKDKNATASACRNKKAAEKANQIGKVTYEELYDGNECDS